MTEEQSFDETLWNNYLLQQQELCKRLHLKHVPTEPYQIIGLADDVSSTPINGLRHTIEGATAGWSFGQESTTALMTFSSQYMLTTCLLLSQKSLNIWVFLLVIGF